METLNSSEVDKGLIAMFLKMSPEQRLEANDKTIRTILELRNAWQQQKNLENKIMAMDRTSELLNR